jgi:serine/threonine protein kinase
MLSGKNPFDGENEDQILKNVLENQVFFPLEDWQENSSEVKDLIKKLLNKDPVERISAKEALQHPWFTSKTNTLNNMNLSFVKNYQ